jgi:phosphoribosylglycinamide formyltransferase-1
MGGVYTKAKALGISFIHMPPPYTAEAYQSLWLELGSPWVALSGWLKRVLGLPTSRVFNIHPWPLPQFGGAGMYGHYVHEAVIAAYKAGQIRYSAVSMHFVDSEFDHGPIFFRYPVLIRPEDDAASLAKRVNKIEHGWQSWVTNLVVSRQIRYEDGSLFVPPWYNFHLPIDLPIHDVE